MPENINTAIGLLSLVITLLTLAYFGVIKGNNNANTIKAHASEIKELKDEIKALKCDKVDKIVFDLIQKSLDEIKQDIRDLRVGKTTTKRPT